MRRIGDALALASIVALLGGIPPATAQQQSNSEIQNGVVVMRGSGPPVPPAPGPAVKAPPPAGMSSYCAALARSNRRGARALRTSLCDEDAQH